MGTGARGFAGLRSLLSTAAVFAAVAGALGAQAAPLPRVHVIATGGTISNLGAAGRRTGEELVAAIPPLRNLARVTVEQFSNVASGSVPATM